MGVAWVLPWEREKKESRQNLISALLNPTPSAPFCHAIETTVIIKDMKLSGGNFRVIEVFVCSWKEIKHINTRYNTN